MKKKYIKLMTCIFCIIYIIAFYTTPLIETSLKQGSHYSSNPNASNLVPFGVSNKTYYDIMQTFTVLEYNEILNSIPKTNEGFNQRVNIISKTKYISEIWITNKTAILLPPFIFLQILKWLAIILFIFSGITYFIDYYKNFKIQRS